MTKETSEFWLAQTARMRLTERIPQVADGDTVTDVRPTTTIWRAHGGGRREGRECAFGCDDGIRCLLAFPLMFKANEMVGAIAPASFRCGSHRIERLNARG